MRASGVRHTFEGSQAGVGLLTEETWDLGLKELLDEDGCLSISGTEGQHRGLELAVSTCREPVKV